MGRDISETAKAVGASRASVYKWLGGKFEPSLAKLAALAAVANVDLDWLITGRGEPRPDALPGYIRPVCRMQPAPLAFESRWLLANLGPRDLEQWAAELRAVLLDEQNPHKLAPPFLLEVPDDSMEPTLKQGDMLLVPQLSDPFDVRRVNGIYAVQLRQRGRPAHAGFVPRRIEWSPGSAIVRCDNPAYPHIIEVRRDARVPDAVSLGRAVWRGHFL